MSATTAPRDVPGIDALPVDALPIDAMALGLVALLLAAGLVGAWRLWRLARAGRLGHGAAALLLALHAGALLALWLAITPPSAPGAPQPLRVYTPDAPRDANANANADADATPTSAAEASPEADPAADARTPQAVALPGADAPAGTPRVPDLATALRLHPDAGALVLLGGGLPPRDLDAAAGRALRPRLGPPPTGLVALRVPDDAVAGRRFTLRGRVAGLAGGRVVLRDPGGARIAEAALADDGGFALEAMARAEGRPRLALEVLDAEGVARERMPVPLAVAAGAPLRVVLLAGAPGAELRALRRWAVDAGLALDARITMSRGVHLGGPPRLDAEALAAADLVVLDERAWRALPAAEREALQAALRDGLGVLLRITGPLAEAEREALAALRLAVEDVPAGTPEASTDVRLDASLLAAPAAARGDGTPREGTPREGTRGPEAAPSFRRRALRVDAADATPLLADADGSPLGLWRGVGRGRLGLWWLDDSHRLQVHGREAAFATLWSQVAGTLARPAAAPMARAGDDRGVDRRRTLCGLGAGAGVRAPSGARVPLHVDRAGCAAWWPAEPGWHRLEAEARGAGDASADAVAPDLAAGTATPPTWLHVRADGEAAGLEATARREDTLRLASAPRPAIDDAATATRAPATSPAPVAPGPALPWALAWLALAAAGWALERRWTRARAGAGAPA